MVLGGLVRLGAFGWLGLDRLLARGNSLRAADGASMAPKADHAILLFLNGGPSHLDTWDMKPDAPAEIRGPFGSIPTSVPGVRFGEHLPLLARQMHRLTVIRSMHHSVNNSHAAAVYCALTGHDRGATDCEGIEPWRSHREFRAGWVPDLTIFCQR